MKFGLFCVFFELFCVVKTSYVEEGELSHLKCHRCLSVNCNIGNVTKEDCELALETLNKDQVFPICPTSNPFVEKDWLRLATDQETSIENNLHKCRKCGRSRSTVKLYKEGEEDLIFLFRILDCISNQRYLEVKNKNTKCISEIHIGNNASFKIETELCEEKDLCENDYCTQGWGLPNSESVNKMLRGIDPDESPLRTEMNAESQMIGMFVLCSVLVVVILGTVAGTLGNMCNEAPS